MKRKGRRAAAARRRMPSPAGVAWLLASARRARRALRRPWAWCRASLAIARHDGPGVGLAFIARSLRAALLPGVRDEGERIAERFLRLLGFRLVARNWRRRADRRDEADLLMLAPSRDTLVVVEVKRAAGPWDPLERIDSAKRAVLWRIAGDLAMRPPVRGIRRVRVDLVAVRGARGSCEVIRHESGFLERDARGP